MTGEIDLKRMLATLDFQLQPEPVVFVVAPDDRGFDTAWATIREPEGRTVVITQSEADASHLPYEFVGAWLTLTVHSDLAAVGLTAAISQCLTEVNISCNVVAGYFHDHLVVPWDRRHDALDALSALRLRHERE